MQLGKDLEAEFKNDLAKLLKENKATLSVVYTAGLHGFDSELECDIEINTMHGKVGHNFSLNEFAQLSNKIEN